MNKNKILLIGFILLLVSFALVTWVNYTVYALVISVSKVLLLLGLSIFVLVIFNKINIRDRNKLILTISTVLLFLSISITSMPKYTYSDALIKVIESESISYKDVITSPRKISIYNGDSYFVDNYYLVTTKGNDSFEYFKVNPVNGEYCKSDKPDKNLSY